MRHSRLSEEFKGRSGRPARYRIQVAGGLDESWSFWFDGLDVSAGDGVTTLTGDVADQAALRGILQSIWDLNLTLLSVNPAEENDVSSDDG